MSFGIKLKDRWCEWYQCWVTFDHLCDAEPLFKVRDTSVDEFGKQDRDFCVYFVYDGAGRVIYVGKGRYWHYEEYGFDLFWQSRPFTHDDFLADQITSDCKIGIIHYGLTDLEARLLEAYYIFKFIMSGRTLTKQNAQIWNGYSLINKKREMVSNFYEVASVHLINCLWRSIVIY